MLNKITLKCGQVIRTLFFFIILIHSSNSEVVKLNVISNGTDLLGESRTLTCRTNDTGVKSLSWLINGQTLKLSFNVSDEAYHEATYSIQNLSLAHFGFYVCKAELLSGDVYNTSYDLQFPVEVEVSLAPQQVVRENETARITCTVRGFPSPENILWYFYYRSGFLTNSSDYTVITKRSNVGEVISTLIVPQASSKTNGTYTCGTVDGKNDTQLIVKGKPKVDLILVKAVGKSKIYLNWTLVDGNAPITSIKLRFFEAKVSNPFNVELKWNQTEYLLKELKAEESYANFTIIAENSIGQSSDTWDEKVTTLKEDPEFRPILSMKGSTANTITLGWSASGNNTDVYNFYNVTVRTMRTGLTQSYTAHENPFMVEQLKSGTDYHFQVQACSTYTSTCDALSNVVNGTTMDGRSGAPRNLSVICRFEPMTKESIVSASWEDPENPHGIISEYNVILSGNASYYDEQGKPAEDKIGPISKTVMYNQAKKIEFRNQPPNTQIFVSVCAKTRTKICGDVAEGHCSTPESIPNSDELSKAYWKAVQKSESAGIYFMVTLPHISQRNGSICCYRLIVVKLKKDQSTTDGLEPPHQIEIKTYEMVHNGTDTGAYVAEMLDPSSRNILIGDNMTVSEEKRQMCHKCWSMSDEGRSYRPPGIYTPSEQRNKNHRKRHAPLQSLIPRDGPLDSSSFYTAFVDAIVINNEKHERMRGQSNYFHPLRPIRVESSSEGMMGAGGVAVVGSLIVALLVVLLALMCVMRWRRKDPGGQEYGFSHSIQQWCRRLRGQQPIPNEEPPNLPPINKEDLVAAYVERHKDSDLGFQQEFEKLPDRFSDRTSSASDHRDNTGKNRYPDIKAYDQSRVKLSTSEGGSDYINANIVVGYKERKKFICAQGPMDSTVVDWWRMIWEQHVHFILMLTNVEEYNKTKCAKYWPSEGPKYSENYGDFIVTHSSEKRYSDFLVRNLKLSKSRSGSGSGNGSGGSEEGVKEERDILQYHYLVWKDFMAPEHPVGILRFIKRFNDAYAPDKGPILVHCSAGVGRTGTLVALDSLLQQMNEEGAVSIFNTICDLRHQRNYLVQSLKQFIFIYRALMEMAQFGDTDVTVSELKSHIEKLKGTSDGKTMSRMQEEYERLMKVIEDRKPFTVGASEENRHRNRHENVIPYDRSRVHLSPMPSLNKEINTYINASFIEGYDNTEQFIIAQDPLDVTIGDFWRMIVEQNIRGIVMLSETGEGKCPRYWPEKDQETTHDYIKVKYMQSQSLPFCYRREFSVTDTKGDHSCLVTQFQYNGWPVGEGEVPSSDRGIVELIETTQKYKETLDKNLAPILVHCSDGADRSCIFVALTILAQQMMNESRVDVFSVVRKLRSQRQALFRNFAQYEFIYKGLVTYAELHVSNGNAPH